jgi:hypothetical protein
MADESKRAAPAPDIEPVAADDSDLAVVVSRIVCDGLCGAAAEGPQIEMGLRAMRWRSVKGKHLCPDCACVWCLGTGALFTGVQCRACWGTGMTRRALERVWAAASREGR